jgi:tetratricopeptide (TPR) repeat protein
MQPLEMPDSHYLLAALGWYELGNRAEARAELQQIRTEYHHHPDVLEMQWLLCAAEEDWKGGLEAARLIVETAPQRSSGWLHQAYALRRVAGGGLKEAMACLLPAAEKFPKEPIIPFNLSCYACQLGEMEQARVWLELAVQVGGKAKIIQLALADPDLAPLWEEIRKF